MANDPNLDWLRAEWQRLFASLGADADAVAGAFAELVESYRSPGRYYHTLTHIEHVLRTIHRLIDQARDPAALLLAGWFHDVIYDSRAKDNEERSAAYADDMLRRLGMGEERRRRVGELILLTKTHEAPADDVDAHVLLDADLAILGAPHEEYQDYAAAIRQEYAWVPDLDYVAGRQAVLTRFLRREPLYQSELLRNELQSRARVHMAHEQRRSIAENEWLQHRPWEQLEFLGRAATERKLRLYVVAACRRVWHLLTDERSRRAVEVAERFADGQADDSEWLDAAHQAFDADPNQNADLISSPQSQGLGPDPGQPHDGSATLAWLAVTGYSPRDSADDVWDCAFWASATLVSTLALHPAPDLQRADARLAAESITRELMHEVFGNPFRPVTLNPASRTSSIVALAQALYDDHAFDRMPILADALEEAGCNNTEIVKHCRQPGGHVRGCWVVDLLLSKS